MNDTLQPELRYRIECLVLASEEPLLMKHAEKLLGNIPADEIRRAVAALNRENSEMGRSFTIVERGDSLIARTRDKFSDLVTALTEERRRLTPSLLQTLAIIAYRQPITRAQLEQIRGVDCGYALGRLLNGGLVRIEGRAEKPGRPLLYGTSKDFLLYFGLSSIDELPRMDELELLATSIKKPRNSVYSLHIDEQESNDEND
jgi:segregation and condensation protein B